MPHRRCVFGTVGPMSWTPRTRVPWFETETDRSKTSWTGHEPQKNEKSWANSDRMSVRWSLILLHSTCKRLAGNSRFHQFFTFFEIFKIQNQKGKRLLVNNESSFESTNQEPLINPRLMYPKREWGKKKEIQNWEKIELNQRILPNEDSRNYFLSFPEIPRVKMSSFF